ncbi:zinc finger (MYND type) family protein /programmed cell death 2 C-terminal domain-containing protein [Striga asiatica]|uniref:Zinc finger (MYND type) family protein /programmed cell death 2 C-terminal domain-containing protein n=1 Tax=Striga asiatica TaxID=4170 RepID=A0A5A7P0B5_STRAF|nr:zinc finger (MYND type) family protein /programmed cell death 2 C-terminal domain-containing protein [Striga asiatica]
MMSLRLIPPGEIAAILLVVTPGLVGERDDILLVVTPGLKCGVGEGSVAALEVPASILEAPTASDLFILRTWISCASLTAASTGLKYLHSSSTPVGSSPLGSQPTVMKCSCSSSSGIGGPAVYEFTVTSTLQAFFGSIL